MLLSLPKKLRVKTKWQSEHVLRSAIFLPKVFYLLDVNANCVYGFTIDGDHHVHIATTN